MKKHWTFKVFLFCTCVIMFAAAFAGCQNSDPVVPEETEIRIPIQTQPETVQTTEMTTETETADLNPNEESGFVHSYPLGSMAYYDLNGDGVLETITANSREDSDGQLMIDDITIEYMAMTPTGYFTVVNVDQSRETLLVGISDYGFSDDDMTVLYAYDGAQITEVGFFEDVLGQNSYDSPGAICHGDGTISARVRMNVLGTWTAMGEYKMNENGLENHTAFYWCMDWENQAAGWEVTSRVEMVMYEDSELTGSQVTVPAGTIVRMIGVKPGSEENHHWACFEADSLGATLWLPTEEVDWQTYVQTENGFINSEEAFDGFFYAG